MTDWHVPALTVPIGFNVTHSPMGAGLCLSLGHPGSPGGLTTLGCALAPQDVFIGVKQGAWGEPGPLTCLPFFTPTAAGPAPERAPCPLGVVSLGDIRRHLGWASDRWVTPTFSFNVYARFGEIPDPALATPSEMRQALLPAVIAELTVDNVNGAGGLTAFFALKIPSGGLRLLDQGMGPGRAGFAWRDQLGVLAEESLLAREEHRGALLRALREARSKADHEASDRLEGILLALRAQPDPVAFQRHSLTQAMSEPHRAHLRGDCAGVAMAVPPGGRRVLRLALGGHVAGPVTTRVVGRPMYARHYASLAEVLDQALVDFADIRDDAWVKDGQLLNSGLSADQQTLLALATRSYFANTQLLDVGGEPFWVVNSGQEGLMNALGLASAQAFFELEHNPWVVRTLLDHVVSKYSYHDEVRHPVTGELTRGGLTFCHDMGSHGQFSPIGTSSHELAGDVGPFAHSSQEQLCDWVLMAASYVAKTGDATWLSDHDPTIAGCLWSMLARGGTPEAGRPAAGLMRRDSSRCEGGAESTAFVALSPLLGQARGSLCLAVRCWAAHLGLAVLFEHLGREEGDPGRADLAGALACSEEVAAEILSHVGPDGLLPAQLDPASPGHGERTLLVVESLAYPLAWQRWRAGRDSWLARWHDDARLPQARLLVSALRRHVALLLQDDAHRFPDGGLRVARGLPASWASKAALAQHVARSLLRLDERGRTLHADAHATGWEQADAALLRWQVTDESAREGWTDQFSERVAAGGRGHPCGVAAQVWMHEVAPPPRSAEVEEA